MARVPRNLPRQAIFNGTHELQVLHITFAMIHTDDVLTLACIRNMLLAH